jgi:hypothetical protein
MTPLHSTLALLILAAAPLTLTADETTTNKPVTFQQDIGPMFEKACVQCHGDRKAKGGLRLGTLEEVMKGAKGGQIVVSGDSAKSRLVQMLTKPGKNGGYAHPPRQPLQEGEISLIRSWIDQGAK